MSQSILALAFFRYPRLIKFSVIYDKVIEDNNFVYAGLLQPRSDLVFRNPTWPRLGLRKTMGTKLGLL